MRKKLFGVALFVGSVFAITLSYAQPGVAPGRVPQGPVAPQVRHMATFESHRGETFTVFVDGRPVNRKPQSRVLVNDLGNPQSQVVVLMQRPTQRVAVLQLRAAEPNMVVSVSYDQRLDQLMLNAPVHSHGAGEGIVQPRPPMPAMHVATEEELADMERRMHSQSFDKDRIMIGKSIVSSGRLTAHQIGRLAKTINFSDSQVEFLKYAYHYCVDPGNYYQAVDVLSFSSDKKKVLDYIATQR